MANEPLTSLEAQRAVVTEAKKEIFESAGKRSFDELYKFVSSAQDILRQEKQEGKGKLADTVEAIKKGPHGNEHFVDGAVAYLPEKGDAIFVGDIHGDAETVTSIVEQTKFVENMEVGDKSRTLVFMGDYADRGAKSIEALEEVLALKMKYPDNVILMRGNHEETYATAIYGLREDLVRKYGDIAGKELLKKYNETFEDMPGVVVTANNIVAVHGGIPNESVSSLKDLNNAKVLEQMRWNDPSEQVTGLEVNWDRSDKDRYRYFGKQPFERFMNTIGGKVMLRGHEYPESKQGSEIIFDGHLATVFSTGEKGVSSGYADKIEVAKIARVSLSQPIESLTDQNFLGVDYQELELAPAAPPPPRVEPTPARVEPVRPTVAAAPEAPAREPLTAAEQQLAAKLMEQYQQKFVPEVSAEPYFGERGRRIEPLPMDEKKDFVSVFQEEIHPAMVKNARDIEMGRRTPTEIAAAMTKEEIFFTYFSDPEHIETRQDLVGLGHALTLLMEKRLAQYYGVREYKFDQEFKRDTQKESDVAFAKFLHTEMGLRTNPELRDELEQLFWMRFSIDRRLRGETYEEGEVRRKEIEFLAIKDRMGRIESWWEGRKIEDTGEYESFVAAFTNTEANRYLDGILKRRMDDMGIAAAERTEALTAPEGVEVSDDIISITEIADLLTGDEGMTLVAKILQEIVKTKKELGDKDTLMQMSRDLGLRLGEKFIDKTAASVRKARQVSVEQDIQSWLFAFLAALIYAITHRER